MLVVTCTPLASAAQRPPPLPGLAPAPHTASTNTFSPCCPHGAGAVSPAGPQLDIPHTVTPQQLETLLNGLLSNEDKLPYSFYIEEQVRPAAGRGRGGQRADAGGCGA